MTYEQALNRAASLCSQAEKCCSDILDKARGWELSQADTARLIDYLKAEGYLNEERYAKAFASDKFRFQHWGRIKIRFALREKGVPSSFIEDAVAEAIDDEEYADACLALVRTRMREMSMPLSQRDRARVFRFAAQRGFEPHVISGALSACQCDDDD